MTAETGPAVGFARLQALVACAADAAREIAAGMARIADAAATAGAGLLGFVRQIQAVDVRRRHGLGNLAGDGTWKSDLCAAWVHGSCPAPAHCDCTCHGGSVR